MKGENADSVVHKWPPSTPRIGVLLVGRDRLGEVLSPSLKLVVGY